MRIALFFCVFLFAAAAQAQSIDLRTTQIAALAGVVEMANAHDGSGRLFLVQQTGQIRILRSGQLLDTPFLDIGASISSGGERGLLGLAFAPDYVTSGRFYVYYTAPNGDVTIARMHVSSSPDRADSASREVLLTIPHSTYANHNGGRLTFGPDGYLYAGVGDGGGGGDPLHSGQSTSTLLGKLLRVDVSPATGYAIPASNPMRGTLGASQEIWAIGLRNPWRFSFDRKTGDLYIADVGQSKVEEIDFQPAGATGGQNYGWNLCEGNLGYSGSCAMAGLSAPVWTYTHDLGCSITGGYLYRGTSYPRLAGMYLYGDYCSGTIWGLTRNASGQFQNTSLKSSGLSITTFGEDESGNVYVADQNKGVYLLSDGAPRHAITPGFTGTWYDPAQSGHGIFVEVLPNAKFGAYWFTFAPSGGQAWFGGVGDIVNDQATLTAVQTLGGKFIPNFDPLALTKPTWGTLTFTFSDCNHGRVDFSSGLGYGTGSMALTRLTLPDGLSCN